MAHSDRRSSPPDAGAATGRLLGAMVDANPDLIQGVRGDGSFAYTNVAWRRTLGYSESDVARLTLLDVIHPEHREACASLLTRILRGEDIGLFEVPFVTSDERILWVEGHSRLLERRLPGNGPVTVGVFRDISLRRILAEQLRETETRASAVVAALPDLMFRLDRDGRLIDGHAADPAQLLHPRDAFLGRLIEDVMPADVSALTRQALSASLDGQGLQRFEYSVELSGTPRYYEARTVKVSAGEALVLCRDVTEARNTALALARSHAELEDSVQARTTELQRTASLLQAAFDATADGLLVVNRQGEVTGVNRQFLQMWQLPDSASHATLDNHLLAMALPQLLEPDAFLRKVRELYARPEDESFDELRLRDGRVFERRSRPQLLAGEVVGRVWSFRDITERERQKQVIEERERLLSESQRVGRIGTWSVDMPSETIRWTPETYRLYGVSPETFVPHAEAIVALIHPDDRAATAEAMQAMRKGASSTSEFRVLLADGSIRVLFGQGGMVSGAAAGAARIVGTVQDVTELRSIEAQFRQSQKMEAIGRLAGGVAHDFNNLLTVIFGYAESIREAVHESDPLASSAAAILKAGDRASALTHQLLAFSRRQILQPAVLRLDEIVQDLVPMLRRLIGEHIELTTRLDHGAGPVLLDRGQMDQVILNLVVNARDAMPTGGHLTIETSALPPHGRAGSPSAGERGGVRLTIRDTGVGMDAATQARIFEPFFTTKGPEHGTGLGLATVYGIVSQSNGEITVESAPGRGACLIIDLPCVDAVSTPAAGPTRAATLSPGSETILLAEDDPDVRTLTGEALRLHGYTVIPVADGGEAVAAAERHAGPIHLFICDVVMPVAGGAEASARVVALRPDVKVLMVSGYTDDVLVRAGVSAGSVALLQKPYTISALLRRVRETLGQG